MTQTRPQFQPRTHRARVALEQTGRAIPGLWAAYERARLTHPAPPGVYITERVGAEAFVQALIESGDHQRAASLLGMSQLDVARIISPHTTLAVWRMTQGIYRIDPAVYPALIDTPLTGDIPADVLTRLPEWCVYVETPGLSVTSRAGNAHMLHGVWARLDTPEAGGHDLVMLLDIEGQPLLETRTLPLAGTLHGALMQIMRDWGESEASADIAARYLRPIINLLLYVGSQGADIDEKHGAPGNPEPKRTRRDGWRLFPADGHRVWDVGVRMGAALRAAYRAAETGQGVERAGPRGHIRRAHWHIFRSGPLKTADGSEIPPEQRHSERRWLPPIPVNLGDVGELPATIRRV